MNPLKIGLWTILVVTLLPSFSKGQQNKPVSSTKIVEAAREFRNAAALISMAQSEFFSFHDADKEEREDAFFEERLKDYLKGRAGLEKSIALNPWFPDAYFLLGNSFEDIEGDSLLAIELLGKAIRLDPTFEAALVRRCELFISLKRFEEARRDVQSLEKIKSEQVEVLNEQITEALNPGEVIR